MCNLCQSLSCFRWSRRSSSSGSSDPLSQELIWALWSLFRHLWNLTRSRWQGARSPEKEIWGAFHRSWSSLCSWKGINLSWFLFADIICFGLSLSIVCTTVIAPLWTVLFSMSGERVLEIELFECLFDELKYQHRLFGWVSWRLLNWQIACNQ